MFVVNLLGSKKTDFQRALQQQLDALHTVHNEPTGHTLLLGFNVRKLPWTSTHSSLCMLCILISILHKFSSQEIMYINYSNFYRSFHFLGKKPQKTRRQIEMGIITLDLLSSFSVTSDGTRKTANLRRSRLYANLTCKLYSMQMLFYRIHSEAVNSNNVTV